MEKLKNLIENIVNNGIRKAVISKPALKSNEYKKITVEQKGKSFQIAKFTEKQVFHENVDLSALPEKLFEIIQGNYRQVNAWSDDFEHMIII